MIDIFEGARASTRCHRFVIYLPTKRKDGTPVEGFEQLASAAEELICRRLGGVTSYPACGAFIRDTGQLQREHIQVLESFSSEDAWREHSPFLGRLAKLLARELDQESIACSLDGEMALATPDEHAPRQIPNLKHCTAAILERLLKNS